jgi:cytosine/adenosine deaminase-related metal-dependent hydrolase
VVASRRGRAAPVEKAVLAGLEESQKAGVTTLAEIATDDSVAGILESADAPHVTVFRELLALLPEQVEPQLAIARAHLEGGGRRGLSPHAPYSVHPGLFDRLIDLASERHAPVAMHLAETPAELELLRDGTGEFVEMLRAFGVWREGLIPRGSRPIVYLRRLADVDRALVVHGNYLDQSELAFVARNPQLTVVYCPRTHSYFGHTPHPWRQLIERGASVAMGTDSRASNPDLSVWSELLFLRHRFPEVPPRLLLELGTVRGAKALGLETETGTIAPGKRADLAVVTLPSRSSDPWTSLFAPENRIETTAIPGSPVNP